MPVSITIPAALRGFADGMGQVESNADTVGGALGELTTRYPRLRSQLYADDRLRTFVNVFLNDENVRWLGGDAARLNNGDTVSIIPSIAGG